jgi:anthranilate phosphoribosyltransferase
MQGVLQGKSSELMLTAIWNSGFYLWRCGVCPDLPTGFAQAEALCVMGAVIQKLEEVKKAIASRQFAHRKPPRNPAFLGQEG